MDTRLLAQSRAPNTSAYAILTKPAKTDITVKNITVCNGHTANVLFSIFLNVAGTTLDSTCALYSSSLLQANTTQIIEWQDGVCFRDGAVGTLGVQANTANVVTFTVNGTVR